MLPKHHSIVCLALAMFCCITSSHAQFSIKGGIGISDIVFSDEGQNPYLGYETDYLTHRYPLLSYQFGVAWKFRLNDHFFLDPELLFVKQGFNYSMEFIYDDIVNRACIYYLQIPLAVSYRFALQKKHHPKLFLGPYMGLKVYSLRVKTYNGYTETTAVDNAKNFDFGFVTGFGYEFQVGNGFIDPEFRVGYSLINILEPLENSLPGYDDPAGLKARNISVTLMICYRFNFSPSKK